MTKADVTQFTVTHRPSSRLHTVMSVTLQPASDITFMIEGKDGKEDTRISVPQYFQDMYGATVKYPRLPCVQVSSYGSFDGR